MRTDLDAAVNHLAATQHGVWTRGQLERLGASRSYASRRVLRGAWQQPHPGTYALAGWERTFRGQALAAAWSMRDGRCSFDTAAALLALPTATGQGDLHVTVPRGRVRARPFRVHEALWLPAWQCTAVGITPVTTVARTLVDLASMWSQSRLSDAWSQSLDRRRTTVDELERVAVGALGRGFPATDLLRRLLADHDDGEPPPQSILEQLLKDVLRGGGYPESVAQMPLDDLCGLEGRADRYLPSLGLVVEADGRRWHTRVADFERDALRNNRVQAAGYHVARFTYRQLTTDVAGVLAILDEHVARHGYRRTASGTWVRSAA